MKPEVSGELFWLVCCKLRLVTGAATRGRFLAIGLVTESRGRVVGTELSVDVGVCVVSQHCFEFCCLELSFLIFWITFFSPFSRPECSRNNYVKPLVTRSDSARTRRIDLMTRNPKKALLHLSNLEFHLYFSYLHTGCNTGLF